MTKTERDRDLTRRCITEKWALLVVEPDAREPECPLCKAYPNCKGCPVAEKAGDSKCHGTPYYEWRTEGPQMMTDWLWALYDELTEKMLAERKLGAPRREGCRDGLTPCTICGREADMYRGDTPVCVRCHRECYDANGNYLVPVVRGGPWGGDGTLWERWQDGVYHWMYYDCRVRGGIVEAREAGPGDWLPRSSYGDTTTAHPGIVFKAPADYIGDVPEGCRWAEGSEPTPCRILEASLDGETWCEVSRTYSKGEVQWTDPGKFHSVRIRHVDADGKTQKTIVTRQEREPEPCEVLEGSLDGKKWFEITRIDAMRVYLHGVANYRRRVRTVDASGKTTWTDESPPYQPAKPRPKADTTPDPWDELMMPPASQRQVTELREHVRTLAQLLKSPWGGLENLEVLEVLLDRLDGDKGEWRGGLAWE